MPTQRADASRPIWNGAIGLIALFTAGYMIAAVAGAVTRGNREFVIYIVVMFALIAVIGAIHRSFRLHTATLAALSLWGLAHMAGGLVPVPESWPIDGDIRVLYSWWIIPGRLKYDQVVHAYGFGVTAWVCWQVLRGWIARWSGRPLEAVRPTLALLVICATSAMGFGALNEIVEFAATLAVPETNVGGYMNTGWDLVSNACGATLACVLIAWVNRPTRIPAAS